MPELNDLETLQALYTDLRALSSSKLSPQLIEKVGVQLDASLHDFRNLLDNNPRNEQSRKSIATGKLDVDGDEYTINEAFQQDALQLADDLNLDERDAARLFLQSQAEADSTGTPPLTMSVIRFHLRRRRLLECLLVILQQAANADQDDVLRAGLQEFVIKIVQPHGSTVRYANQCLSSMAGIKALLQSLADKLNSASVLGQEQQPDLLERVEFQRGSLAMQHELLGVILFLLIKQNYSPLEDFELVLDTLKKADKYDNLLLHYIPALGAYMARFGGTEGGGTMAEARAINDKFFGRAEQNTWSLTYVHAAFRVWWLAEYSGWYGENADGSIPDNQLADEAKQRSKHFTEALKDGAFDFILCLSADAKSLEWYDPARQGLRQWLQRKTPVILAGIVPFSDSFQDALIQQLETFVEAFITNLPDVLRKLRLDEDEQRQLNKEHDHDLDLERFLVIICFVFEGRPKAAFEGFWEDREGALMGFVHWASRRASTPLVTAFCEMLQSLSEDEECATATHEFLLDEGAQSSGKMRRTHSLSWNQIFKELTFFSSKIRDRPALPQTQTFRPGKPQSDLMEVEPESSMMLESYLRLITRLSTESGAVRQYLAQHPSFRITDLLFQLTSSAIGPRLRACAFTTLRSLLSHKTKEASDYLWTALDIWISGGYAPGSAMPKTGSSTSVVSPVSGVSTILGGLTSGFEEPNAFVKLLQALVAPYEDGSTLRDCLPFPENLGVSSRMPGIDPYVDFVLGQIFSSRASDLNDPIQQRVLRLSCLDFIATCIDTFNEALIIFASQSNVAVDIAISASTLESYVLLHPFSRVMEWMLNDKVMTALFSTIQQDDRLVSYAASDSPLILSLLRGIHVVKSVLELQATYLHIIRPLIKSHPSFGRTPVPNTTFSSFEDGLLSHLSILPILSRYCSTGHPELVIASIGLLERLSTSPKLTAVSGSVLSRGAGKNKALAALDDDAEGIARIFLREMEEEIDVNQGAECPEYIIKLRILDFLISSLRASPDHPTVAHMLLGFRCGDRTVDADSEGSFSRGISLFHTILDSVLNAPLIDDTGMASWLLSLSYKGLQVLQELWSSPISSSLVMMEMRSNDAFFTMFAGENMIQPDILWDGLEVSNPLFMSTSSAGCLSEFMCRRAILLRYSAAELRNVVTTHSPSLKQRIFETLMGSTRDGQGQTCRHATVFDLFDFMGPQFHRPLKPSHASWFQDVDVQSCLSDQDKPSFTYDIGKLEELFSLRRSELIQANKLDAQGVAAVNHQAQELLDFYTNENNIKILFAARLTVLRSWVQLLLLMLESGNSGNTSQTSIMLQTLRTIMPILETDLENVPEAMELARLAKSVVFNLDFKSQSFKQDNMGDLVSDRLFHLFQVSLKAINSLGSKIPLKQFFYLISYRYLMGMSDVATISGIHRRHSIQTIKSAGERFMDVVCDDAYASEPISRIAALFILGALVEMGKRENSKYIIESLIRLNFITILVGSIENIPNDLLETSPEDVDMQLAYCNARLALLLHLSQTRFGAAAVLNAGLFHAISQSGLFATDPDLGVNIDGPDAVSKHYGILAAIMRVICAALLSRGAQNQQSLEQGRRFLADNRLSILAVLKKTAGLGSGTGVSEQAEELADSFMLLVTFTGFLEFEENATPKRVSLTGFT
ncbi:Uncharacterized protein BP5553_04096 [Venustampulla echinocandica]|uniref:Nucleoporin n=1 Tax=Venustampulla echinocandica TaxID=2656787 RepID=A0A370TW49_9HELO|nr:Uncharacterized protein BP5553_04096 [Venustampulla echinocandica]RDL39756.1 Uncharacterized protein BP5553_04096 [Venustampulla echinocandica]